MHRNKPRLELLGSVLRKTLTIQFSVSKKQETRFKTALKIIATVWWTLFCIQRRGKARNEMHQCVWLPFRQFDCEAVWALGHLTIWLFEYMAVGQNSAANKSQQRQEKNSWECRESNPGLLGENQGCYPYYSSIVFGVIKSSTSFWYISLLRYFRKWIRTFDRSRPSSHVGRLRQVLRPPALPSGDRGLGIVQLVGLLEADRDLRRDASDRGQQQVCSREGVMKKF